MAGTLDIEIVTAERVVFRDEGVDMVVAPGGAGTWASCRSMHL